ncbi:MAG: CoA transferase, partial [SAR324 cluster bacterium]|nr:CoA transferase [SAR324 cluster bacterium]
MLPLSGLRVISVEQYGAGPFGTTYLADLGADVIKIENPREGGDLGRRVGPYFFGPGDSHFYQSSNRNKRSLALDLQQPGGREVLRDLVRGAGGGPAADGVLNNLRGDQPAKLGLTYHDLKDANRAIVCAHLSAYGREGSRASWPGFDYLMQSETGYLALTGEPDGPPARAGLSIVDFMTGLTAAFALLAGIISARATGTGRDLDVSLFDVALYNLNYLATYTTDRCTTCHIAIDDPAFSRENLARRLEASLPAIEEALARDNATDSAFAYPSVPASLVAPLGAEASERAREAHDTKVAALTGKVVDHWPTLSDTERKVYFSALLAVVNDYFDRTGRKRIELEQPLLAHPDLDLYVSLDSPHPAKTVGCTVCHEGNPQETDFVLAAHSPETHKLRDDWAEKYYISRMGWVGTTFETIDHYWDRPMLLPKYTEAGCAKCHTQVADISDFEGQRKGAQINLGRYLFKSVGCVNCHNDDDLAGSRRVGPDLTHVAEKLTPGFVQQWAWFPQAFNPASNMPHFFMQENTNSKSDDPDDPDPDPVGRTQAEVLSISRYLFAVSQPWTPLAAPEAAPRVEAEAIEVGGSVWLHGIGSPGDVLTEPNEQGEFELLLGPLRARVTVDQVERAEPATGHDPRPTAPTLPPAPPHGS